MPDYLLVIDQGTSSSRAIVFSHDGCLLSMAQHEFSQHFPQEGWVEHDPEEIWQSCLQSCHEALQSANLSAADIKAIGITNQRETTLVWDKNTGQLVYPAIVWQDRRTAQLCEALQADEGLKQTIQAKTGLLLDPYFSATKLAWILEHVPGARARAETGELAFGTIDTFLLWRLTQGQVFATDASNASRTMLFDIHRQCWDQELLQRFNIPEIMLPKVKDSADDYGYTAPGIFGAAIAIRGVAGDQQAALIGQSCFKEGMAKSTYGTGCFLVMNTGDKALQSNNRLLTTVAYRLQGKVTYALEGSIFVAGAAMQWLRDGLQLIDHSSDSYALAKATGASNSVYLVPAFTGLGAPYWDPHARGALLGLTLGTGIKEVVTAGLQAVAYQTRDLLNAMAEDGARPAELRVDGGMVANKWMVQFLSDCLQLPIARPQITETTALGAAYLAALGAGMVTGVEELENYWQLEQGFNPQLERQISDELYQGWLDAVARVSS